MKSKYFFLVGLPLIGCLPSCGQKPEGKEDRLEQGVSGPVETLDPNTSYKPAFAGQTRVPAVRTATAWQAEIVTKDLNRPWGIVLLPDGRLLISEKQGRLRIVSKDGVVGGVIRGLPAVNDAGQGGLLDVVLDPDYSNNRTVYWSFSEHLSDGNVTAVGKGVLSADERQIENARVIYRALPAYGGTLHYGSRLAFDRQGFLYVSTGERSDLATRPQAQDLRSALGKVLRLTKEGQAAPNNPFIGRSGALPEIFTYGHRNVQGLAIHPETGALWENEFGPRGGDELNLIEAGKNYGWPIISYGIEYSGEPIGAGLTQREGLEQPVYYWDPVLSPSGMTFYASNFLPEWKGNLFICGLNSNHIARLVLAGNRVIGEERLLQKEHQRFRDIAEGSDGELFAITDEGRLYRIARKSR